MLFPHRLNVVKEPRRGVCSVFVVTGTRLDTGIMQWVY